MSLPANTPPAITDTLGYLQHHLQELTKHQNALEHIINATLAGLTAQLQQLTQLITTPAPTVTLPLIPTSLPPVSPLPWFRPPHLNSRWGQNSLLLQTSLVNRALVKSSLTPVHYIYAWPQSSSAVTRRKSYGLSPFSKMDKLRGGSRTSFAIRGQPWDRLDNLVGFASASIPTDPRSLLSTVPFPLVRVSITVLHSYIW